MELENGRYRGRAVEGALGITGKGTEQIGVRFALLDRPGEHITWYGFFTSAAKHITIAALRVAGFIGADLSDLSSLSRPDAPEVLLVVENEEYDGTVRPKVKWVNPVGGLAMKDQITGQAAAAFAARMKGEFAAYDAAAPGPRQRTADPSPPAAEPDLPF